MDRMRNIELKLGHNVNLLNQKMLPKLKINVVFNKSYTR